MRTRPGAASIHADCDLLALQDGGERHARKLAALIGVEYLRCPEARQRFLQSFDAEIGLQRNRQPPAEYPPAKPVDDRDQIDKAARHRDVRDVGRPNLVGPRHRQLAQQIRIDLVPRCRLRRVRPPVDSLDRHLRHQRRDLQPADLDAFGSKQVAQHTAARKREIHV